MQRLENILVQTAAPKVPEWPSYCNFRKVTQKSAKGGPREIFQKMGQKVASLKKPKKTLKQMALSSN